MMELSLRERKSKWNKSNYRELLSCKMPRITCTPSKRSRGKELYSIQVIESTVNKVKVHYVGYSSRYDEWKDKSEIKVINSEPENTSHVKDKPDAYEPFSLHRELYQDKESIIL